MDTRHYWEIILHYVSISHMYSNFVEGFDKLINFSFLYPKHTNPPQTEYYPSLMSAEAKPINLHGTWIQSPEDIGQE